MQFGNEIKNLRLDKRISLREFCRLTFQDASNWSKIERGVAQPPQDEKKLRTIADVLGIDQNSEKFKDLVDLAAIEAGKIPNHETLSDEQTLKALPIFFRTIRNKRPSEEQIKELVDTIRKGG